MSGAIEETTSVTIGVILAVGGFLLGFFRWFVGLKKDVDKHTFQLDEIEKRVKSNTALHTVIQTSIENQAKDNHAQSERMARIETKIDLILDKKIK